jgi:hypothetical protein
MAVLSTTERAAGTAAYSEECSNERSALELTKVNLRAAYDAADTWADTNAAAFNTALPVAARTALTASQKARLLLHVVRRRYQNGL